MASRRLTQKLIAASSSSATAALVNMLTTVAIARWLGDQVYVNYIVDLAVISIVLILLEVVPSNYVVFKVQDCPEWINSAASQAVVSILLIILVTVGIGELFSVFKQYTNWVAAYAALMPIKRFLDIRQQSTGNISEFLKIEAGIAMLRLLLLYIFVQREIDPATCVWMSLALATAAIQGVWFFTHPVDLQPFAYCVRATSFATIVANRSAYGNYYFGVILKRIRDNLIPLAAERFFLQRDELASFFLAYRGVAFASSQIRILEAILSHRASLNFILGLPPSKKVLIASLAQIAAIVSSALILLLADPDRVDPMAAFYISLVVWPYTYSMLMRTDAYSQYKAGVVNASMALYVTMLITICATLMVADLTSGAAFSLAVFVAECVGLLPLYVLGNNRRK